MVEELIKGPPDFKSSALNHSVTLPPFGVTLDDTKIHCHLEFAFYTQNTYKIEGSWRSHNG